jgi:hypothetical protein
MDPTPENINPALASLRRQLSDLKLDPKNARKHPKRSIEAIAASLSKFGQQKPIVALKDGTVIAGNGTLEAARSLGWASVACVTFDDVRKAKAYAIADNRSAELSEWNDEALLESVGQIPDDLFDSLGFLPIELDEIRSDLNPEQPYTRVIESPVYQPKGKKPPIGELMDRSKTSALIAEIDKAKLPDEVATFLKCAAERHTAFNFSRIADFYANADKKTQRLFENSALVIIDFNRAVELGFVKLSHSLADIYTSDHGSIDA